MCRMTDVRPQYGEFASVEEQRLRAGLPPADVVDQTVPPLPPVEVSTQVKPVGARPWDRIITIALLAWGLVNVLTSAGAYLDLPSVMNQSMELLGIDGEFTNFQQGRVWGTAAAVILVLGWAMTAFISFRRLRTGKRTWWIPLVGAAITLLIASVCLMVPMMGDPAFMSYLSSGGGIS